MTAKFSVSARLVSIGMVSVLVMLLAGLLAICLIRPDRPAIEYPSINWILEKIFESYRLIDQPEVSVDNPHDSGTRILENDLFGFSTILIIGICYIESALMNYEDGKYEDALFLISEGSWNICAITTESGPSWSTEETPGLQPYLPHSGSTDVDTSVTPPPSMSTDSSYSLSLLCWEPSSHIWTFASVTSPPPRL